MAFQRRKDAGIRIMPKELHEIKKFLTGIITTPSETDIPDDAAAYSLNVDPVAEDGKLKGIPDDTSLKTDGTWGDSSLATVDASKMAMINNDGQRDVIYYEADTNKIHNITDFYVDNDSFAQNDMGAQANSEDVCAMQVNNKEVHIGMGKGANDKPLWAGIIPHGQFGGSVPIGIQLEDAELKPPSPFIAFSKVFCDQDENYLFGYKHGGTNLYKLDINTEALVKKSPDFDDIMGACRSDEDGEDFIWLLNDASGTITLKKVSMETLKVSASFATTGLNTTCIDILHVYANSGSNVFLWVKDTSTNSGIFRAAVPALGATAAFSDVCFKNNYAGDDENDCGAFVNYVDPDWVGGTIMFMEFTERGCLFKPASITNSSSNAWVGFSCMIRRTGSPSTSFVHSNDGTADDRIEIFQDATPDKAKMLQIVMRDDFSNNGYLNADSDVEAILSSSSGGLCVIDTTPGWWFEEGDADDYGLKGFCAGNDDVGLIIVENSNADKSDIYSVSLIGGSDNNGDSINRDATNDTGIDVEDATGVVIKDNSTIKAHLFSGDNVARWAYGALNSLSGISEAEVEITVSADSDSGELMGADEYFYRASWVYDGYQESPLTFYVLDSRSPVGDDESHNLEIKIRGTTGLSSRITHLNIYCASGVYALNGSPASYYRLVESIEVGGDWLATDSDTSTPDWGNFYTKEITDNGSYGASYEALNGISEVVENTILNYSLSAQLNNQHFVARCSSSFLDDIDLFLFKSGPYNFDQFDWSQDLLRLPTKPTALASFNGRIFAFDENNTYRIEPNELYIEDTFEGVGCIGPDAVCVTEYGMCFADKNNIYLHDGRQPIPIGNAILRGYTISWENKSSSFVPKVMFDAERNAFVIFMEVASSYYAWVYTLSRKRWDLWAASHPKGILSGKNGEMFISDGTNLIYYLGSTTETDNWTWQSKKLTMGTDTQDKIFKRTRITFSDSPSDCLDTVTTSSGTITGSNKVYADDSDNAKYTYSGDNRKGKWIQYTISDESVEVDAIGTIFRRRLAK